MPYAELHCKTNFSFLEGAAHPDELVQKAAQRQYHALAITDRNSLAGVVRAHTAAKEHALKLLVGAEITPVDGLPLVLLATDRAAYGRLAQLITIGRGRAPKGECELYVEDVAQYQQGLLALAIPPQQDPLPLASLNTNLATYAEIFADRGYLLAELLYGVDDSHRLNQLQQLSTATQLPLVAAGDVHYHLPARMLLQHLLTAVRHGTTVAELGDKLLPNAERHLRRLSDIDKIFAAAPAAIERTREIADRCTFSLDDLRYEYPEELAPAGEKPMDYLRRLSVEGAHRRYPQGPSEKLRRQLDHELALIEELHYEAYFLTVHDLVRFARSRGILCQGRGSAANSVVCYCLEVTAVNPQQTDLLFERFISRERNEAPDIDVDFEHERREEVLQYIYDKYGRDRAGMTAVVNCYRVRSAIRDVGKALGLSLDRVDALAKNVDFRSESEVFAKRCRQSGLEPTSRLGQQFVTLVNELVGFPRHLSQHVGGMVMTQGTLSQLVPIENAAMEGRTVIQWNKDDLDDLGILKVDCLSLGMLTAIRKSFEFVQKHYGRRLQISDFESADDKHVYEMISQADTVGVFQVESRAQMSMLPRLRPQCFYDLVIEVAIVRPGPIQGDMVHPYLRRREMSAEPLEKELRETCPTPGLRKVLQRTLGVPLFQEQAMQLAVEAAGFTPGEADQLRRAMAGWRRPGLIDNFRIKLLEGMRARGYSMSFAERLFKQIRGFGEYGFPESHAASFARLVYVSAWLKHYYPAVFLAAMINSQPMGFYAPAQLMRDARQHGVEVLPIDVHRSDWDCTLEPPTSAAGSQTRSVDLDSSTQLLGDQDARPRSDWAVRLGLRLVRGLSQNAAENIMAARQEKWFECVADLTRRCHLDRGTIRRLAEANALESLQLERRAALWEALDPVPTAADCPLFIHAPPEKTLPPPLPQLSPQEDVYKDYQTTGLTLKQHPIAFIRDELDRRHVLSADQLIHQPNNHAVRVAGLVLMRQRPSTAKGITFVTLEDETGIANLIIHLKTWQRYDQIARRAGALIAHGKLERKNEVVHIIVRRLQDLTEIANLPPLRSRDFR